MQHRLPPALAALAIVTAAGVAGAQAAPATAPKPSGTTATAPTKATDTLAFDPLVRRGTLPNGVRYYIRKNTRPEKRAELRLAVDAGAILEDDDQRGLAHFTEHMAFNGTRRFEKAEIVNFLERIGMSFGADLNAYTSFDETVYMLQLPTDSAAAFRKGFEVLADWATGVSFDSTEVEKERGVVVEEWRSRRGAQARVQDRQLPVLLRGSRYADRLPIGGKEALETFKQASLRRFYQRWYRPDLMAVVAVGDFDPDTVEALVRREFAGIARPATPAARATFDVPGNDTTLFAVATDKELTGSSVSILWKLPKRHEVTVADYRRELVEELADNMLNQRLSELTQKPESPLIGAISGSGGFVRAADVYQLGGAVKEGRIVPAMEALLTEAERAARHGFLASELAREKADMLRAYERAYAERDKTPSTAYAGEYVDAFLEREPAPGIAAEWQLVQQYVPGITLDEVNAVAKSRLGDRNRVVLASAPEKAGLEAPTEAQLRAAFAKVKGSQVVAYVDSATTGALIETLPKPGKVTATAPLPAIGATQWTLSNGVKVIVKTTDFQADQVQMQAFSPGGQSLVADSLVVPASFATELVRRGGVGRFSMIDLNKALTGKVARVQPFISELSEGMAGNASPKDLETMLQLVHLYFTAPRRDSSAFRAFLGQVEPQLRNRSAAPQAVFIDTLTATLSRYSPRQPLPTPALLERMNLDRSLAIYRDRFADASDFTFVFVGNVKPEELRPLAERYLATLPATRRKETYRDVAPTPPPGRVEKVVKKGQEPKAQTQVVFHGPATVTPQERMAFAALREVLDIRLREALREDKGGTYGVGVQGELSTLPTPRYRVGIGFGTGPEKLDELMQEVWKIVDSLKKADVTADELTKVKETQRRQRETALKQNAFWTGRLVNELQEGRPLGSFLGDDKLVEALTPAMIRAAAVKYLDTSRYVRGTLYPDGWSGPTTATP